MRNLSELNINDGGRPIKRPAPTKKVIKAFQAHFGFVLPENYLRVLAYSNGGHPELDTIHLAGRTEAPCWAVNRFFHLDEDRTSAGSLWAVTERWRSKLGVYALPFAADATGNQFFLDLRIIPPSVKVCVHDQHFAIKEVAPTLEAFLGALSLGDDMV